MQAIGSLGLLSVLIVSGSRGIVRADDITEKQTEPVAQNTSTAATTQAIPDPSANPQPGKSNSGQKDKLASDKRMARAKFLAVFLKLFEGYRGAAP